ncbi:recombinase RecT [Methylobacterium haplocladii]|uniref:Uncharacterized protein n=1 Tax=Methylobacterium haplocladii TaxID=1176176 RepID=A0A512IS90_9HYPH|nr:recombinase RecT [Methylobacterium haplocladii]GEP00578.1 hypothetical protein MHA02_29650 [Methylobacterium haplocladii]GJD85493.1 hypothetical protein HPGCJGGD_3382 [Methylobacterium haplocladii]GLS57726.1 hypothetical protein GCM10007887_03820 [Methylobacterium haplocladii]
MSHALELTQTERKIAERIDPSSMDGLTVSSSAGGIVFANAAEVMNYAKMMAVANSGVRKHLRGNVGACLAIVTQAVEWGMSAYAVANKSYFFNDQIAFESQLVQAVILKRAPIKGRIKFEFTGEGEKRKCRAWARLADDPEEIAEYISPEFGKITPKNSPLWKSDPDQQHCYYAGRALCRRHFPDVLLGVYGEDELTPPPPGPDNARDVTPAKGLNAKLDALAARPKSQIDHAEDAEFSEAFTGGDHETGANETVPESDGGGDDPAPDIDPQSAAYKLGHDGGMKGFRKGLTAAIKEDPAQLANYEAGYSAALHEKNREDD